MGHLEDFTSELPGCQEHKFSQQGHICNEQVRQAARAPPGRYSHFSGKTAKNFHLLGGFLLLFDSRTRLKPAVRMEDEVISRKSSEVYLCTSSGSGFPLPQQNSVLSVWSMFICLFLCLRLHHI